MEIPEGYAPGPWVQSHRLCSDGMYRTQVYRADDPDNPIATICWHRVETARGFRTDRDANARLIARAPEMADEIKRLRNMLNSADEPVEGE